MSRLSHDELDTIFKYTLKNRYLKIYIVKKETGDIVEQYESPIIFTDEVERVKSSFRDKFPDYSCWIVARLNGGNKRIGGKIIAARNGNEFIDYECIAIDPEETLPILNCEAYQLKIEIVEC